MSADGREIMPDENFDRLGNPFASPLHLIRSFLLILLPICPLFALTLHNVIRFQVSFQRPSLSATME